MVGACGSGDDGSSRDPPETASAAIVASRPNIVFFMTDDQNLEQMVALPSVRELIADRGVSFDNAINPLPLCCPARASLLTGTYPHNHGVVSNRAESGGGFDGLDQTNTLARWLDDAGYRTGHVGKYMNGYSQKSTIPTGWDEWWAASGNPFLMYDYTLNHNGVEESFGYEPEDYKTDVLTGLALDFVEDAAPRPEPFYLQLWYTAPHSEQGTDSTGRKFNDAPRPAPRHENLEVADEFPSDPSFDEEDVSDKPAWVQALPPIPPGREEAIARNVRGKLASLAAVDEGIRQVIEAVEATGEQDETVLVFTSDNGYLHGEHRFPSGKEAVYEPAIRAPFYVAGPGFEAETAVPGPITFTDLAPTLAGLAGATLGLTSDGRTLHETMADPEADRAILVLSGIDIPAERQFTAVRTMGWLYATYPETGDVELYDLRDDPHELESRHADEDFREQRAALEGLLAALTGCAGPSCQVRVPDSLR